MNLQSVPYVVVAILILFLSVTVYSRSRHSKLNIAFALYGLAISVWLFGRIMSYYTNDIRTSLYFGRISYSGVIFIPILGYHFVTLFLNSPKDKKLLPVVYGIGVIFLYLCNFTDYFLIEMHKYSWGFYPKGTIIQTYCFIFFIILFNRMILNLIFKINDKSVRMTSTQAIQTKYLHRAIIISTMTGFDFLPIYGINSYAFGYITTLIFFSVIAYSIVRHRFMDIRIAITRTGIFVALYSLILGIPFWIGYKYQSNLILYFHEEWWLFPLATSTVLATAGPFIYLFLNKKAENALLKEQKSYQNILRNASSGMIRVKDLNRLLNLIVHVVTKTVRIRNASIYLFDQENNYFILHAIRGDGFSKQVSKIIDGGSPLIWTLTSKKSFIVAEEEIMRLGEEENNISLLKLVDQLLNLKAELVVPSFVDERLIGFIVLGEKVSKKPYSQDDMNVFSVLANQAALAIENAQFYDEIKQTHEQLFQAEKLATIGTMADGLSHQINNRFHALSLISGDALDIINTSDLVNVSPEVKQLVTDLKDALQKIQNNVLQGGEVVKGLLKYSRPGESGFEPIDFKDVLKGSLDMVQYKIKLIEIDFLEKIVPDLPKIHGNLTQLQEVFFNLIDNAYDATRERKITLKEKDYKGRVEVIARVNEKNNIEINVIDNGMGIKDLDKKKMFTPFFTTKATAKKGTGLGLYVIKKIVSAHNGTISVGSAYEKGTHFVIEFPLNHEIPVKTT